MIKNYSYPLDPSWSTEEISSVLYFLNQVEKAYEGKVVILGDADLGPSDCRIEWADGGIERDVRALWEEIDHVLAEVQTIEHPNSDQQPQEPSAKAGA